MLATTFADRGDGPLRVLAVGAHSDDLEIGCGATLLTLAASGRDLSVDWVVCAAADETRAAEAEAGAAAMLANVDVRVRIEGFRDGFLPYEGAAVKELFESLKPCAPDVVLTHWHGDAHQDHRLVAELAANTFRDHAVLGFEIPKYDGDLATPNLYVPVTREAAERKAEILMATFASQHDRTWFEPELFLSLMRLRGLECNAPSGYAEGFHSRKLTLTW
jgi:LmbE family N-acetylglucosaminyl deacetylase